MLLGTSDDVCRQIDYFIAAGVTHFVLTLSPYNFEVFERFAADVLPRYRDRGSRVASSNTTTSAR